MKVTYRRYNGGGFKVREEVTVNRSEISKGPNSIGHYTVKRTEELIASWDLWQSDTGILVRHLERVVVS